MTMRLVIDKPPHWLVYDPGGKQQLSSLSSFLQAAHGNRFPILHDAQHQFGFLHRLDVPSSGLILVAKSYEAYNDLRVQLSSGEIVALILTTMIIINSDNNRNNNDNNYNNDNNDNHNDYNNDKNNNNNNNNININNNNNNINSNNNSNNNKQQ